jgi:hypothetical protein
MLLKIKSKIIFLAMAVFFIAVSFLLVEVNYITFLALTDVFKILNSISYSFGLLLITFSIVFMLMLLIERYYSNKIIRFFYISSAAWMGALVYFFIASVLYITLNIFIFVSNDIGLLLFIAAGIVSIYGFLKGRQIKVKNINIYLPGLNEKWKGKTIVYMSDLHLGPIRGARFAEKVKKISNSLSPDIVFIGGDLYDGSHKPDPFFIARPLKDLLSNSGVFFITGNHEEFRDPSIFIKAVSDLGIQVLDDRMVEIDNLQIVGVDYLKTSNKKRLEDILVGMNIDVKKPSILLKHEPSNLDVAYKAGISFQISGHTHNGQQWPFNYLTYLMYKGFSYGLKSYKSMQVYVSSGTGGWGPSLRVGSQCEIVCIKLI